MKNKNKVEHGANLFQISQKYGFELSEIMDFSSNINPFGASDKAISIIRDHPEIVSIYPDPAYTNLRQAIETYSGVSSDNILLGSGATSLISGFISEIKPRNALVQKPAYSEYEKELHKNKATIHEYILSRENDFSPSSEDIIALSIEKNCDLIVLCNPNNPTGSLLSKEDIRQILQQTTAYVMVDETYIEFTEKDRYSAVSLVSQYDRLFVIRGTSKFFSTPGIRLGYAMISDQAILDAFENYTDLWGINIFADAMGSVMFLDKDYHQKTYDLIHTQRTYLMNELSSFPELKVYPSYGNFILSHILTEEFTAGDLHEYLLERKIIIRNCKSFQGLSEYFFRVCTLKPQENRLLIEGIADFLASR